MEKDSIYKIIRRLADHTVPSEYRPTIRNWIISDRDVPEKETAMRRIWLETQAEADESTYRSLQATLQKIHRTHLHSGKVRLQGRRLFINLTKYAAVIAIVLVNIWLLADKFIPEERVPLHTKIEVPQGQRIHMTLQDGTEAWLSPRSVIKIPNEFGKGERSVELDGEGFFAVTKDANRPFVVKTPRYNIKVLGTRFNVFAYSESERFETNLVNGSVQVINNRKPEENILLKPNEMVSLSNGNLIKTTAVFNNEEYLKSGIFSFRNKKFSEILSYLTLWYDVKFDIKSSAEIDRYVSGKFRQSDEIERILKALQGVHPFRYKILNKEEIEIY